MSDPDEGLECSKIEGWVFERWANSPREAREAMVEGSLVQNQKTEGPYLPGLGEVYRVQNGKVVFWYDTITAGYKWEPTHYFGDHTRYAILQPKADVESVLGLKLLTPDLKSPFAGRPNIADGAPVQYSREWTTIPGGCYVCVDSEKSRGICSAGSGDGLVLCLMECRQPLDSPPPYSLAIEVYGEVRVLAVQGVDWTEETTRRVPVGLRVWVKDWWYKSVYGMMTLTPDQKALLSLPWPVEEPVMRSPEWAEMMAKAGQLVRPVIANRGYAMRYVHTLHHSWQQRYAKDGPWTDAPAPTSVLTVTAWKLADEPEPKVGSWQWARKVGETEPYPEVTRRGGSVWWNERRYDKGWGVWERQSSSGAWAPGEGPTSGDNWEIAPVEPVKPERQVVEFNSYGIVRCPFCSEVTNNMTAMRDVDFAGWAFRYEGREFVAGQPIMFWSTYWDHDGGAGCKAVHPYGVVFERVGKE